jgi:VIT1/CCC1 family predicted Fe2+/Mn2+ transporter
MIEPGATSTSSTYSSRFLFRFGIFAIASAVMLLPFVLTADGPASYVAYILIRAVATISAFGATVLLAFDWSINRSLARRASHAPDDRLL